VVRIALGIEYDGRDFNGWQIQKDSDQAKKVRTVQACLEQALSQVANHPVRVHCAGRTDTGVHGCEQVVHFDAQTERTDHSWMFGANANLPKDVSVLWAKPVGEDFHARFSALRRRYRYIILNRPVRPALRSGHVTWEYRPLDVARMNEGATYLQGEQDFSSFRAYACQAKSPVRTVYELKVTRDAENICIDIEANAFLHHMVRNIAGVLMAVGAGEHDSVWVKQVLDAQDRVQGGVTAPASGLYLMAVTYPEDFGIPSIR